MDTLLLTIILLCATSFAAADDYTFQSGDIIELFVYNNPELNGDYRINVDGNIRIPLVGKVHALGKSEQQLDELLHEAIKKFVKNPYITIIPKYSVSIIGYVKNPGVYTITGSERIIEVIAQAGGFSPDASEKISIYRNNKTINLSKNSVIKDDSLIGFIQPGDVIVAKRKMFTRGDYSMMITAIYAISISIYYISEKK